MNLIKDQKGYLLTFWMIFFGFIFLPILALSIELVALLLCPGTDCQCC